MKRCLSLLALSLLGCQSSPTVSTQTNEPTRVVGHAPEVAHSPRREHLLRATVRRQRLEVGPAPTQVATSGLVVAARQLAPAPLPAARPLAFEVVPPRSYDRRPVYSSAHTDIDGFLARHKEFIRRENEAILARRRLFAKRPPT